MLVSIISVVVAIISGLALLLVLAIIPSAFLLGMVKPNVIALLLSKQSMTRKQVVKWVGAIELGAIIVAVGFGIWDSDLSALRKIEKEESSRQPTTQANQPNQPQATTLALIAFDKAEVSEASVKTELSGDYESGHKIDLKDITEVRVTPHGGTDDPNDKIVSVFYTFKAWNEKDTLRISTASSLEIFKRLFANPQVAKVVTFAQLPTTDKSGKTQTDTAVKLTMSRETANKIDWDGLKENVQLDYSSLLDVVDDSSIDTSLQKELR